MLAGLLMSPYLSLCPRLLLDTNKRRWVEQTTSQFALISPEETVISLFDLIVGSLLFLRVRKMRYKTKLSFWAYFTKETNNSNSFRYCLQSVAGLPRRPAFFLTVCQHISHTMCICLLLPPGNKSGLTELLLRDCSNELLCDITCCPSLQLNHIVLVQSFRHCDSRAAGWYKNPDPPMCWCCFGDGWPSDCRSGWPATWETLPSRTRHIPTTLPLFCCNEFKIDKDLLICTDRRRTRWLPQQVLLLVFRGVNLITGGVWPSDQHLLQFAY